MEHAKRNKGNPRSGFSLVELLVAMAITGVVMAAVMFCKNRLQKCSKTDGQQST
jgi:prepilin-type N-terminal cleavage/methylation domain-containing protein